MALLIHRYNDELQEAIRRRGYAMVPASALRPNPLNPRQIFDPEALAELTESVRVFGVLEPLLVTPSGDGELIVVAGERRRRAAIEAGLDKVPVIIQERDRAQQMAILLIENLMRADLSPVEEARGLKQLLEECGMTQDELAKQLGKSQPWVANRLRLLRLPESVLEAVQEGKLSAGHAQVLLKYERAPDVIEKAAKDIVKGARPVDSTDSTVRKILVEDSATRPLGRGGYVGNRWTEVDFDFKTCAECPDRIQTDGETFCHNPQCWDKKQADAQAAAMEATKSKLQGGQVVTLKAVEKTGAKFVSHYEFKDFPECSACEHRKQVQVYSQHDTRPICLDPKCHRRKVIAAGKAAKVEVRQQLKAALDEAAAAAGSAAASLEHNHLVFLLCSLLLRADGGTYFTQDIKWPTNTEFAKSVLGIDDWPRQMQFYNAQQVERCKPLVAQVASLPDDRLRAALVHWALLAWSPKELGPLVELVGLGQAQQEAAAALDDAGTPEAPK